MPCSSQHLDSVQLALEQIDLIRRLVNKHSDSMVLVTTAEGTYTLCPRIYEFAKKYAAVKSRTHNINTKHLNAPRLARMKIRLAIHLAYGQFDLTSSFARYFEYFRLSSPGRHFAIQKNMWTTVRGRTFEGHQFKMLAIFHRTENLSTSNYNEYST